MRILTLAMALALFGIGAAWAQAATYSLTGMGTGVMGTSKCATYQIIIDVTVDGKTVKGLFKQQGRPERAFAATLDDKGGFKTRADVGEGVKTQFHRQSSCRPLQLDPRSSGVSSPSPVGVG